MIGGGGSWPDGRVDIWLAERRLEGSGDRAMQVEGGWLGGWLGADVDVVGVSGAGMEYHLRRADTYEAVIGSCPFSSRRLLPLGAATRVSE